jgi:hypothetical protein
MSLPDFEEYRRRKPDVAAKSSKNLLDLSAELVTSSAENHSSPMRTVSAERLAQMLQDKHKQHVLYISDLISVTQGTKSGDASGTCVPKCDYEAMKPGLLKALNAFESIDGCHPFDGYLTIK